MNMLKLKIPGKEIIISILLIYLSLFLSGCQNPLWSNGKDGIKVITGTVKRGVEAECWILVSNSGKSYELIDERSTGIKKESLKVVVIGKIELVASFCMQGTPLEVLNYKILD
jgi:hypothetical protein